MPSILAHLLRLRGQTPRAFRIGATLLVVMTFGGVAAYATALDLEPLHMDQAMVTQHLGRPPIEKTAGGNGSFVREERIGSADTYGTLAHRLGVSDPAAFQFILTDTLAQKIFEELRPGKVVTASTLEDGRLAKLTFPLNDQANAIVVESLTGRFIARKTPLPMESRILIKSSEIKSSFFAAADSMDLPDPIATQMADIFGGEIDFHRDLRRSDRFSAVYEMGFVDGGPTRAGRILAAEFVNEGRAHRAIWFNDGSAQGGYYTPDGQSLKTAFLRSPIEFSRISSGFSMRLHPILQTWRAHRGIDYAAPIGTPIRATADGVVEELSRHNGYGNLAVLRHGTQYSTWYGHLDGFAWGLKRGMTVRQGQIIGYVGRTGWATGPHLHYELRINDVQQDPLKMAMPVRRALQPAQMIAFRQLAAQHAGALDRLQSINLSQLD